MKIKSRERTGNFLEIIKNTKKWLFFNTSKRRVIQKSASVDFNYNEKHFQKVDFIRAQNLGIFYMQGA